MLTITRTQPAGSAVATFLDATVILRDGNDKIPGCPDIPFNIRTYNKIAKDETNNEGDRILLPVNMFLETLTLSEQKAIYAMYKFSIDETHRMIVENMREIQDTIQEKVFDTVRKLNLANRMMDFCRTSSFVYPDLSSVGTLPHHSAEKNYYLEDYIEITAICILSKIMVPIWGEFINQLNLIGIDANHREKISFDLIEPTLEDGPFERIYNRLSYFLNSLISDIRVATEKRSVGNATTSFILTHNGIDDQMFNDIVMATIITKRMATYECWTERNDGNPPNVMVYINDGIGRAAGNRIKAMRNSMNTMPRRELPKRDTEDNSSIIDHASKMSKKPIDTPVLVTVAVETWELPRLLEETDTPIDIYLRAAEYYTSNPFDVSPLAQAAIASFVGTRFGGSKCIGYLPIPLWQKVVIMLQVFLIRNGMVNLAALISSNTSSAPIDGVISPVGSRISANLKTHHEYQRCLTVFKGYLEKPSHQYGKRNQKKSTEVDKIDFVTHISKMAEWIIRYSHSENMAPALWEFAQVENRPIVGSDCRIDENIIRDLCRFYLLFHDERRPF